NGLLSDGSNGEPARIKDFSGEPTGYRVEHYTAGRLNDPAEGSPAVTVCARSPDYQGEAIVARHYKDGDLHSGPKGEPSHQVFDGAGKLIAAFRVRKDGSATPLNRFSRAHAQKKYHLT